MTGTILKHMLDRLVICHYVIWQRPHPSSFTCTPLLQQQEWIVKIQQIYLKKINKIKFTVKILQITLKAKITDLSSLARLLIS